MCFKKPQLPAKTAEDIQTEEDLKAMRAAQQREIALSNTDLKDAQTEASFARIMGMTGNRSLIAGPKGGAGYMGNNSGRTTGRVTGGGAPIAPNIAPVVQEVAPMLSGLNFGTIGTIANFSGFSSNFAASAPASIAAPAPAPAASASLISRPSGSRRDAFTGNTNLNRV